MVGGTVIGIIRRGDGTTRLHVRANKGEGCCLAEVTEKRKTGGAPVKVAIGDEAWFKDETVLWTEKEDGKILADARFDVAIPLRGRVIVCGCIHVE